MSNPCITEVDWLRKALQFVIDDDCEGVQCKQCCADMVKVAKHYLAKADEAGKDVSTAPDFVITAEIMANMFGGNLSKRIALAKRIREALREAWTLGVCAEYRRNQAKLSVVSVANPIRFAIPGKHDK
jgi:hypothetical protein